MRTCFRPSDPLSSIDEHVISEHSSLRDAVGRIIADCGLPRRPRPSYMRARQLQHLPLRTVDSGA
jgi:hypothetical protein